MSNIRRHWIGIPRGNKNCISFPEQGEFNLSIIRCLAKGRLGVTLIKTTIEVGLEYFPSLYNKSSHWLFVAGSSRVGDKDQSIHTGLRNKASAMLAVVKSVNIRHRNVFVYLYVSSAVPRLTRTRAQQGIECVFSEPFVISYLINPSTHYPLAVLLLLFS